MIKNKSVSNNLLGRSRMNDETTGMMRQRDHLGRRRTRRRSSLKTTVPEEMLIIARLLVWPWCVGKLLVGASMIERN